MKTASNEVLEKYLKEANHTIDHFNSGYTDKIVFFYYVTNENYIMWFLASKYTARNQLLKLPPVRTCWIGCPPEDHFLKDLMDQLFGVRLQMDENLRNITKEQCDDAYWGELQPYVGTDELRPTDRLFINE